MMIISNNEIKRIETQLEVETYIDRLKYAITNGHAKLQFQQVRIVDTKKR